MLIDPVRLRSHTSNSELFWTALSVVSRHLWDTSVLSHFFRLLRAFSSFFAVRHMLASITNIHHRFRTTNTATEMPRIWTQWRDTRNIFYLPPKLFYSKINGKILRKVALMVITIISHNHRDCGFMVSKSSSDTKSVNVRKCYNISLKYLQKNTLVLC